MCVCVSGGLRCRRKAGASKWTKSGPSGPSSSSCLLFRGPKNGAKNRPQKRGRNIAGRRKGFQNGGPVSGTRVLYTQSAPFCVQWVAETPEPFVRFPGNGLDKASSKFHSIYIYIYLSYTHTHIYIEREWNATRSPKIRGFKRFFDYFMLFFPLLIIYERSKFLGDALLLIC